MAKILQFKPKKPSHIKIAKEESAKLLNHIKKPNILLIIICILFPPIGCLILLFKRKQLGYFIYLVLPPLFFYSVIYCIIIGNYVLVQLHIQ
jgi:hypothetical protein